MTTIKSDRILRRETATKVRQRPIIVELHPSFIQIYEKGKRVRFSAPYDVVYDLARRVASRGN